MKKGFVYGALCALTLAAPATAEKFYVPVLGTTGADGSVLATKVWVADADGAERQVATSAERAGLVAVEADSFESVRALMTGRGGDAEAPVFTAEELYQAGTDVPLADLPKPRAMKSLLVGAANLSDKTASCLATLLSRDGSRLGEAAFDVEPMSLARRDGLTAARGRVAEVHVTCDQNFYPFAVAAEVSGKPPIVAKGIGPNGSCNLFLTMVKRPDGSYTTVGPPGVFHDATKANPKGIICIRVLETLKIGKATFEWDTTAGPWATRDHSGLHNLGYYFLDRYRSGVIGNINQAGPNKNFLKFMQNIGMAPGSNTNNKVDYTMQTGATYHQVYTYDAANKMATMQLFLNGALVAKVSKDTKPGNDQTLIIKPFGTGALQSVGMVAEFGNYFGQHAPEEASVGWKFANFQALMIPKKN
ncbi:MAG: hypothetical protein ABIS20_16750 [Thermoanaerobaculia bacterium]